MFSELGQLNLMATTNQQDLRLEKQQHWKTIDSL
jgi:hypothetical protein